MCRSMVYIQSVATEIRRGKKIAEEEEERKKLQGKNIMAPLLHRAAITKLVICLCLSLRLQVHRFYRTTGASFTKAQQEFAEGVVTNRTVQQTATGVAASAARGAVDQYGSGGSSRY